MSSTLRGHEPLHDERKSRRSYDGNGGGYSSGGGSYGTSGYSGSSYVSYGSGGGCQICNGVVFMCNRETLDECLRRSLFGTIASQQYKMTSRISPDATRVFLYNTSTKAFLGPFRAAGKPAMELEPEAWSRGTARTPFPLQLRVHVEGREVYQLHEQELADALTYIPGRNGRMHFETSLSATQAERAGERLLRHGQVVPGPNGGLHGPHGVVHGQTGAGGVGEPSRWRMSAGKAWPHGGERTIPGCVGSWM